jgi:hypothetical protein
MLPLTADGSRELVTVIEAIRADGFSHAPTILLKGKNLLRRYLTHRIPNARYGVTERGWTNDVEGLKWVKHFAETTRPDDPSSWRMLLIDGHSSHKSIEFIKTCLDEKVKQSISCDVTHN